MTTLTARLFAAAIAGLLPLAVLPAPAHAANVTIVSRTGSTAGSPSIHVATTSCMFPDATDVAFPGSVDRVPLAGGGLGAGVLRIQQGSQPNLLSGVSFDSRTLSALSVFRTNIRFSLPSKLYSAIRLTQQNTSWIALAESQNTFAQDTWHLADAMTMPYFWIEQGGANQEEPAMTISQFVAAHGSGQASGFIGAGPCNGFFAATVYADNFRVSDGANTQIFDFEVPLVPTVGITTSAATITNGGTVTLSTTLKYGSTVLPGRQMRLYAQSGSDPATLVATATTNSSGAAKAVLTPQKSTIYAWYFAEAGDYGSKWSTGITIGVKAKVTLTLASTTLKPGQTLVANGQVTPAKVGSTATLWRKTSSKPVNLGSVTVSAADGTFQISKALSAKGTYNVYVTVPAADGNLAGTSPTRTAKVS